MPFPGTPAPRLLAPPAFCGGWRGAARPLGALGTWQTEAAGRQPAGPGGRPFPLLPRARRRRPGGRRAFQAPGGSQSVDRPVRPEGGAPSPWPRWRERRAGAGAPRGGSAPPLAREAGAGRPPLVRPAGQSPKAAGGGGGRACGTPEPTGGSAGPSRIEPPRRRPRSSAAQGSDLRASGAAATPRGQERGSRAGEAASRAQPVPAAEHHDPLQQGPFLRAFGRGQE